MPYVVFLRVIPHKEEFVNFSSWKGIKDWMVVSEKDFCDAFHRKIIY